MDFEKLLKEQQKTNEILERLEKAGTFKNFLSQIEPKEPKFEDNPFHQVDAWDYKAILSVKGQILARGMLHVYDEYQKMKYALDYVDNLYKGYIKQWEQYKEWLEQNPNQKGHWESYIENPVCLQFFEDYEKEHDIKDSIYQKAKEAKSGKARTKV